MITFKTTLTQTNPGYASVSNVISHKYVYLGRAKYF